MGWALPGGGDHPVKKKASLIAQVFEADRRRISLHVSCSTLSLTFKKRRIVRKEERRKAVKKASPPQTRAHNCHFVGGGGETFHGNQASIIMFPLPLVSCSFFLESR